MLLQAFENGAALAAFLNDGNCALLVARLVSRVCRRTAANPAATLMAAQESRRIGLSNDLKLEDMVDSALVLFKLQPVAVTEARAPSLRPRVTGHRRTWPPWCCNPRCSAALRPRCTRPCTRCTRPCCCGWISRSPAGITRRSDAKWSKTFDPKLQKLLGELEAGLGVAVRHGSKGTRRWLAASASPRTGRHQQQPGQHIAPRGRVQVLDGRCQPRQPAGGAVRGRWVEPH